MVDVDTRAIVNLTAFMPSRLLALRRKTGGDSFKEIAELHGAELDANDPKQRTRFRRMLDKEYERGLSEKVYSQKSAEHYLSRVAGKPVTPQDVNVTVTHQSTEQHLESIRETIAALKTRVN